MKTPLSFLIILSLLTVFRLFAAAADQPPRQVTVNGIGKVTAVPDQARLSIQVSEEGSRVDSVTQQTRQKMESVLKVLKSQGIAEKDIQTQAYQVAPKMEWKNGRSNRVGYTASNQLSVTVRDLKKTGSVLAAVLDAGANTITGPHFEFAQPQELERQALKLALQDAKAKAALLAEGAGATLGEVLTIHETGVSRPGPPRPLMMRANMAMEKSGEEPIASGEEAIQANVSASFLLK